MIFLHGIYKFAKKRVGFRNDWCNCCKAENIAEQFRTFNAWHFFFIPVIPLGFHKNWHCTSCGNDPRERTKESPTLLIIGGALMGFMSVMGVYAAIAASGESAKDRLMFLGVSAGLGLGAYGCWWLYKRQQNEPDGPPTEIPPLTGDTCPYCSSRLVAQPETTCTGCGVKRY